MVEVLVVGAGPAGSTAATLLARAGVRVLLVDRDTFPRHKLCGDTLNPGTLALLQRLDLPLPPDTPALPLGGMIVSSHGVSVRGSYPGGQTALAVRRADLDWFLLRRAQAAGARFCERVLATAPLVDDTGPAGPVVRGAVLRTATGRTMRVPASLTIVAEGRGARLARALGLAAVPARPRRWAVGAYVDDVADLTTCGEMHVRRGHYLGIAPLPGGAANICLVTDERAGLARPLARLLAAFRGDPMLRDRFARARPVAPAVSVGPLALDVKATGCPGLLLAGDAAGFIDPMTGDGLRFAIAGAAFAARAALEALDTGTTGSASAVDRWRRRAFASKWRFNRSLRWLVAHPLPLRVAAAAAAICPSLIRATIAVAGDCPRDTEEVELGWQTLG